MPDIGLEAPSTLRLHAYREQDCEAAVTFPLEDEPTVGNTEELEEQEHTYEAAHEDADESDSSALGGSDGTTDGQ